MRHSACMKNSRDIVKLAFAYLTDVPLHPSGIHVCQIYRVFCTIVRDGESTHQEDVGKKD